MDNFTFLLLQKCTSLTKSSMIMIGDHLQESTIFTASNGDRLDVPNHIFMFTDGNSNVNMGDTIPMAIRLRSSGVKISILGIGNDANTLELRGKHTISLQPS